MKPIISIIVPVYRVPEKYLRKCIESLRNQTFKKIEIILIDDGSPDKCGSICDEYKKRDDRIVVIHKKNGGLSAARNTGFYEATGEWITFVDGDDWINPETCMELYNAVKRDSKIELVMCGISKDYGKSSTIYKFDLVDGKVYNKEECKYLQTRLLVLDGNIACAYAKLIKRSFLVDNNIIHDEILKQGSEALEFNIRLFDKLECATFVYKPFYHYIYNDQSISASTDESNNQFVLACFEKIKKLIENNDNSKILLKNFYNRLVHVIVTTAISGYFNPQNGMDFNKKVKKYKNYLGQSLVQETLEKADLENIQFSKRLTFNLIKRGNFRGVSAIAYIRKKQLINK